MPLQTGNQNGCHKKLANQINDHAHTPGVVIG